MRRGLVGIEPTPAHPNGAGYASLNLSATAGMRTYKINDVLVSVVYNGVEDRACVFSFLRLCLPNAGRRTRPGQCFEVTV